MNRVQAASRVTLVVAMTALVLPLPAGGEAGAARPSAASAGAVVADGVVRSASTTPVAPTSERTGPPLSVAVVGDSISQGTGSNGRGSPGGSIGSPRPAASWATGTQQGLESYTQRLAELTGGGVVTHDLSANGASIRNDLVDQVSRVPEGTDLVLVQMGGNDLCRPSVDDMTPLEVARTEIQTALSWLRDHRPETLVVVASIPDIYSLWYVRGAAHRGEQYPVVGFVVSGRDGPRAPRSFAENNNKRAARLLWETLGVIPCRSLLAQPNSPRNDGPTPDPTHPAEQRRLTVRAHNIALNEIWVAECEAMLRCFDDGGAVFDVVSNRDADGVLLADKDEWTFVDRDISTQDHFHPSFSGQQKLAETVWRAGPDWSDEEPPSVFAAFRPGPGVEGPSSHGWYSGPVTVELQARDDAGVRGIEYRVHRPDSTNSDPDWLPVSGDRAVVPVRGEGEIWLEYRALDLNGNVSRSEFVVARIDVGAPIATISSPSQGQEVLLGERVSGRHACDDQVSGIVTCDASVRSGADIDTSTVGTHELTLRAVDAADNVTVRRHEYHVRYTWSGTTGPLERGQPRRFTVGTPIPVSFTLSDADGQAVSGARFEVGVIGPSGRERAATPRLGGESFAWRVWASAAGAQFFLIDTSTMVAGVWDIVIRPDDGSEHRVNLVLVDP